MSGIAKAGFSFLKNLTTGGKKSITPGGAINKVPTNVPKTPVEKKIRDLKIETQKLKGSGKKLDQTVFEIQNKKPITFKKSDKKTESNREAYKRIQGENTKVLKSMIDKATEKKAKGGRVGLKFGSGTKRKTNVQKIQETFEPKKKVPNKFKGFSKLPEKVQQKIDAKLAKKV